MTDRKIAIFFGLLGLTGIVAQIRVAFMRPDDAPTWLPLVLTYATITCFILAFLSLLPLQRIWGGIRRRLGFPIRAQGPAADMQIRDVFFHIDPHVLEGDGQRWLSAGRAILDELALGNLKARGRPLPAGSDPFASYDEAQSSPDEILASYWPKADFTYRFFADNQRFYPHTIPPHESGLHPYADLQVSRARVMQIWPKANPSVKWPDFEKWDQMQEFQLYEAACLFFDAEPQLPMPAKAQALFREWKYQWLHKTPNHLSVLVTINEAVESAYTTAKELPDKTFHPHMMVKRASLITWCEARHEYPLFLFPYRRG